MPKKKSKRSKKKTKNLKRFNVFLRCVVNDEVQVWATNEDEALEVARRELDSLGWSEWKPENAYEITK